MRNEAELNQPIYVQVILPRCPRCNGTAFRGNHTTRWSSGQTVRHSRVQNVWAAGEHHTKMTFPTVGKSELSTHENLPY